MASADRTPPLVSGEAPRAAPPKTRAGTSLVLHTSNYLGAKLLPSAINFAAFSLYTRLTTPEEFGFYATVMASVYLLNALFFQWLRSSVLRFSDQLSRESLASTIAATYVTVAAITCVPAIFMIAFRPEGLGGNWGAWALGIGVLWSMAWHDLMLTQMRVALKSTRYGLASVLRAAVSAGLGVALAALGHGVNGILVGLLVGYLTSAAVYTPRDMFRFSLANWSWPYVRCFLAYGMPLTLNFGFSFIISSSDRLLLATLLNSDAVGVYAAAFDLARGTVEVLMAAVNAAAFTLVLRALNSHGTAAATAQLRQNIQLLVAIAFPAAVGLALIAPQLANVILGAEFRVYASKLIPFAAASVLLAGLRSFYVDQAFQLQGRTGLQAWALGIGAALNVGLNLWWIPTHGVYGAAAATVVAYLVALGASWVLSRRAFALPVPLAEIAGVAAGCTIMASALQLWPWSGGAAQVLGQVLWGASVYAATLLVIDYAGVRTYLRKGWLRLRSANQ